MKMTPYTIDNGESHSVVPVLTPNIETSPIHPQGGSYPDNTISTPGSHSSASPSLTISTPKTGHSTTPLSALFPHQGAME